MKIPLDGEPPAAGDGSPGSHPHNDRPNWQPGDNDADELLRQKIMDALRDGKGERQIAKLLGVSRMMSWRGRAMAAIPKGLYERLSAAGVGIKAKIYLGRLFSGDEDKLAPEAEYCPHCGGLLRVRNKDILHALDILQQWIDEGSPNEAPDGEKNDR